MNPYTAHREGLISKEERDARIMSDARIAELEIALRQVIAIVAGERNPNWRDQHATTWSRGRIADICNIALGQPDMPRDPIGFAVLEPAVESSDD